MVEIDLTTAAVIVGMAGIIASFYFNAVNQRRTAAKLKKDEAEAKRLEKIQEDKDRVNERDAFAQKVDLSISKGVDGLQDKIGGKLEVIKVTTQGLEKRFDDWRIINRDEIQSIKQELGKLYDDLDNLDKSGTLGDADKIRIAMNRVESLEKRILDIEWKLAHPFTTAKGQEDLAHMTNEEMVKEDGKQQQSQ